MVKVITCLKNSTLEIPPELLPSSRDPEPRVGIGGSAQRALAVRAAAKSEFLLVQFPTAAWAGGEKHVIGSIRGREAGSHVTSISLALRFHGLVSGRSDQSLCYQAFPSAWAPCAHWVGLRMLALLWPFHTRWCDPPLVLLPWDMNKPQLFHPTLGI